MMQYRHYLIMLTGLLVAVSAWATWVPFSENLETQQPVQVRVQSVGNSATSLKVSLAGLIIDEEQENGAVYKK